MKNIAIVVLCLFSNFVQSKAETTPTNLSIEAEKTVSADAYFPVLKPGSWIGVKQGAVQHTLIGKPEAPELVIGFGIDKSENFVFLMQNDAAKLDIQKTINTAYNNLNSMSVQFELSAILDNQALTASGNPFSSEIVLSKKHMLEAHRILKAKKLIISIPRRTTFMAISQEAPAELLEKFMYLHSYTWDDDSYNNSQIINSLLIVENGEIVGLIPLNT